MCRIPKMAISTLIISSGRPVLRSLSAIVSVALMAPSETRRLIKVWNQKLEEARTQEWTQTHRLPEGKENDELDRQDLQEWLVLLDILTGLVIELNQAVHGDSDGNRFNDNSLVRRY